MSTYFIGTCTYEFPNAYTQWFTQRVTGAANRGRAEQVVAATTAQPTNPATHVLRHDEVRRGLSQIPDARTRAVVQLKAAGYSHAEIAEALGANGFPGETDNSVRGLWQRHRQRMHRQGGPDDV